MIDNCLGFTAIEFGITGDHLLSTIVAAPAVIGMETVSIVLGLLRVVGYRAIKKLFLKIEKHEKIAMLAVSISSLISKALWDGSISDEECSEKKEDLREKSKISLEKTGNIKIEAKELLRRSKIDIPTSVHVQNHVQNRVQNHVQNHIENRA